MPIPVIHVLSVADFSFFFLGLYLRHTKVPRLGVELVPQLPTTATAMPDPSCNFNLHCSSWQHQTLNPLREARDRTHIIMDTSWVLNPLSHNGNSHQLILYLCCQIILPEQFLFSFLAYKKTFKVPQCTIHTIRRSAL